MIQLDEVISKINDVRIVDDLSNVIVICDPGVDDALMLLQILNTAQYNVIGIIPIEGNGTYKITLQNTINICEYIGQLDIKIYPSSAYFAQNPLKINMAPIYGDNALSGLTIPNATKLKPQKISGVEFACEVLHHQQCTIISTGPLTEIANILSSLKHNNVNSLKNILAISMMGGVINSAQEANWPIIGLRQSEANFSYDLPATKLVLDICHQFQIPIILTPLDLTHSVLACKSDINLLNNNIAQPIQKLAKSLIENIPSHYQTRYGLGPNYEYRQPLHDVHASNCLINPYLYHGIWSNVQLSPLSQTGSLTVDIATKGNVFLLDMHYYNRQMFFNDLIKSYA